VTPLTRRKIIDACVSLAPDDLHRLIQLAIDGNEKCAALCGQKVEKWLLEKDRAAVARFGRLVDNPTRADSTTLTAEEAVYWAIMHWFMDGKTTMPTKGELAKYCGAPLRTIQRVYLKIQEQTGLGLDERKAENIWLDTTDS
jgi:hypothetical protein